MAVRIFTFLCAAGLDPGIDRRILACAASMAPGVNFLLWTGPMLRASAALKLPIPEIYNPLIGLNALHGHRLSQGYDPYEVRVRVAARTKTMAEAVKIGNEVETLYTNGPAGGGGAWKSARPVVSIASALIPEAAVRPSATVLDV